MIHRQRTAMLQAASRAVARTQGREVLLASLLVVIAVAALLGNRSQQAEARLAIDRNQAFLLHAERSLSLLKDVETSQRGFLLTGDDVYLATAQAARAAIPGELDAMRHTALPLDTLPADIAARLRSADDGIAARRRSGLAGAVAFVQTGQGRTAMNATRHTVAQLEDDANRRTRAARRHSDIAGAVLGTIAALCLAGAFAFLFLLAWRRRQESREGAALLRAVMENAPVGLGLLDRDLSVRSMNRALIAMGGNAAGGGAAGGVAIAPIGRSFWEVMPAARHALETDLRYVARGGGAVRSASFSTETPGTAESEDPHAFEVSVFPLGRSAARRDREGGAGIVVADVTARHRGERLLREGEQRLRTLIEASAAIVWTALAEGGFAAHEERWCRFTGQAHEAAAGSGWLEAVHPADRDATIAAWRHAVEGRASYQVEHRLRRADGEYRVMAVRAEPILRDDGTVREWVGTHTDITERRHAEELLVAARDTAEAANRAKSTFLANMSHELRTPLSAVIGYAEMLEEEVEETGQEHLLGDLRKIESNARHLLGLINDVLDLSKIEANRMTTYAEDFAVDDLLHDAAATVESLVAKNANTLVLDLAPDLGRMHSDVVKLRQCLFNLIGNAAKFTTNGRITLEARREGSGTLRFAVHDTGIGMTAEQLGRLFQRFSQADEGTTRQFGGTGLGLAITRAFARLLGGDVTVESVPNQGTTFTIRVPDRLPEQAVAPAADAAAGAAGVASAGPDSRLVLVIDDDDAQRELLARFLLRDGFSVRTASDGEEGLRLARELAPAAILLDVLMPRMDGWTVLEQLKSDPALACIPVVMASFVNEPALGRALGAVDYLLKPVDRRALHQAMERFRDGDGDVLVVDDDAQARARLRQALERGGWTVDEAAHGREALERLEVAVPRLVLLDLTMPVMDGFEFLHALRQRPDCAHLPVVVLSARDLTPDHREELADATEILRKGDVDLRVLPRHLKDLVATARPADAAALPGGDHPPAAHDAEPAA